MITLIASVFGLIIGSFLNVCIYRWPRDQSVVRPRSHCRHCNSVVGWKDNIPLLSYFLLKGHCRSCRGPISILYPIVEFLNAVLWGYLFWRDGLDPVTFKLAIFTSMMLILIFTDLTEYILPDEITIGGLLVAALFIPDWRPLYWRNVAFCRATSRMACFRGRVCFLSISHRRSSLHPPQYLLPYAQNRGPRAWRRQNDGYASSILGTSANGHDFDVRFDRRCSNWPGHNSHHPQAVAASITFW